MAHKDNPFISIIIPVFNEEKFLRALLASIREQSYSEKDYEIIVVDNGSSDSSAEIARSMGSTVVMLRNATVASLRNFGVRFAKGNLIAFIDADCVAAANWLEKAAAIYSEGFSVFGSRVLVPENSAWLVRAWFSQRREERCIVSYINSANLFIERELFGRVGGFNEKLISGEDYDICLRAREQGEAIVSEPQIKVFHYRNPENILFFIRREIWHGVGSIQSVGKHKIDKALIGTLIFMIFSLLQISGLVWSRDLFQWATMGILCLLAFSSLHNVLKHRNYRYFLAIMFLYYFYFMGRSFSFFTLKRKRSRFIRELA